VIAKAPTLQVGIKGENTTKPYWIQLDSIDLSKHVIWTTLDDSAGGEQAMQATITKYIDMEYFEFDKRPGWRVVIMQHTTLNVLDVLVVFNHSHGDGKSAKLFHQFLLAELNKPDANDHQQNLTLTLEDSSKNFPPPTEKAGDLSLSLGFVLKEAWEEYKPGAASSSNPTDAKWAPIRPLPYKSRVRVFTIPQHLLSNVLSACRDHKATLTALIDTLPLISLASQIEAELAPGFASCTAIDQRRFLPPHSKRYPWLDPKETIANYVTIMYHKFGVDLVSEVRSKISESTTEGDLSKDLLDLLWKTSARVRNEIAKRLDMGLRDDMVGLMKLVPDWRKKHLKDAKKPRALSWFVTNIGLFEELPTTVTEETFDPETHWKVCRAQFTASAEPPAWALIFAVASVKNGDLVVTCTWQDNAVEESLVEKLMWDMERWLVQIGT
jgi:hypothetical protein